MDSKNFVLKLYFLIYTLILTFFMTFPAKPSPEKKPISLDQIVNSTVLMRVSFDIPSFDDMSQLSESEKRHIHNIVSQRLSTLQSGVASRIPLSSSLVFLFRLLSNMRSNIGVLTKSTRFRRAALPNSLSSKNNSNIIPVGIIPIEFLCSIPKAAKRVPNG